MGEDDCNYTYQNRCLKEIVLRHVIQGFQAATGGSEGSWNGLAISADSCVFLLEIWVLMPWFRE